MLRLAVSRFSPSSLVMKSTFCSAAFPSNIGEFNERLEGLTENPLALMKFFNNLEGVEYHPDQTTYKILAQTMAKSKGVDTALSVLELMSQAKVVPDAGTRAELTALFKDSSSSIKDKADYFLKE